MKEILLSAFFTIILVTGTQAEDTIKIMPVGNSITAGEHYKYPPLEERTGYRKDLYEMLINSGYCVDFVGSQNHGIRSEDDKDWYDWNCEAYPGWKIPDIAGRVEIALKTYKPDILLVHVGTNGHGWNNKPGQVKDMMDMINDFSVDNNHPMTVFLCLIINRFKGGDTLTTQFNKEVASILESMEYQAKADAKVSSIVSKRNVDRDYGDVDVLAWREGGETIYAIECKDLFFAKTSKQEERLLKKAEGNCSRISIKLM